MSSPLSSAEFVAIAGSFDISAGPDALVQQWIYFTRIWSLKKMIAVPREQCMDLFSGWQILARGQAKSFVQIYKFSVQVQMFQAELFPNDLFL